MIAGIGVQGGHCVGCRDEARGKYDGRDQGWRCEAKYERRGGGCRRPSSAVSQGEITLLAPCPCSYPSVHAARKFNTHSVKEARIVQPFDTLD